jgi:hypothetical protein
MGNVKFCEKLMDPFLVASLHSAGQREAKGNRNLPPHCPSERSEETIEHFIDAE